MKLIPLSKGKFALVDDEDYEWASQFNWFAIQPKWNGGCFYAVRHLPRPDRKMPFMHREIAERAGILSDPVKKVDHWDRDGLNNRRGNLREATGTQNNANSTKRRNAKTSKFKGVAWNRPSGTWCARIKCWGKNRYLGSFFDEKMAALAYRLAAEKAFGEFAHAGITP